jgi:alpha-tubulin suppressor-like RCC1 family protein
MSTEAVCFGNNLDGQLGAGVSSGPSDRPLSVVRATAPGNLTDVAQIAGGAYHTCAALGSGQAVCFGWNDNGQLGDGRRGTSSARPVTVLNTAGTGPLSGVREVSPGGAAAIGSQHTCALLSTGRAVCWGGNASGQLGNNLLGTDTSRPVEVVALSGSAPLDGVADIDTGSDHSCAVLASGSVVCWGENADGQLGDDRRGTDSGRPRTVLDESGAAMLSGAIEVVAGRAHTCARDVSGVVRCWGHNAYGQLGDGTTTDRSTPVRVLSP